MSDNGSAPSSSPLRRVAREPRTVAGAILAAELIAGLAFVGVKLAHNHPTAAPQPASSTPAPPPYVAIPGCYKSVPPAERPKTLNIVGCASVAVALQDMSWSAWGAQGADGAGTAVFKVCDPNCAMGYQLTDQVVVHAWNPQSPKADATCPVGLKIFADMILAFPKGVPPATTQKMNTQYNGMPAVHYANYSTDKADSEFIGYTFCY